MICPDCKSEMSKKWQARSPGDATVASGLVWSCGVCGSQLTVADMKSHGQMQHKIEMEQEPVSSLVSLPRTALSHWPSTDIKQNRG
jgi:hypothetical protein